MSMPAQMHELSLAIISISTTSCRHQFIWNLYMLLATYRPAICIIIILSTVRKEILTSKKFDEFSLAKI